MLGIELGGYRSVSEMEFRLLLFLINQAYQAPNIAAITTAAPTPAPIPALAPVERPPPPPPPPPGCVVALAPAAPASVVTGETLVKVVAGEEATT